MSNVNTLQSSEQDNTLLYLDEHRIYLYNTMLHNNGICCKKKPSDIRNKMYYIFWEYKVQDSELAPLYHVGGIIADIKVCRLYV